MKTYQKGFIIQLLLTVIILCFIGGAYFFTHRNTTTPVASEKGLRSVQTNASIGVKSDQSGQKTQGVTNPATSVDGTAKSTNGNDKQMIQSADFTVSSFEHNTAIVIKDPRGLELGYDPKSGNYVNDHCIEDGYYADVDGGPPADTGVEECDIASPFPGTYTVSILGISGTAHSYELDTSIYYSDNSSSFKAINGTSTMGSIDNYSINVGN